MWDILVEDLTDARLWLIVLIVTAVGLIEKIAIYRIGQRSTEADLTRVLGFDPERKAWVEKRLRNKGTYIILLASIPGIGAVIAAVAGSVGIATAVFVILVAVSNLVRNWLIVISTGAVASLF